MVQTVNFMYPRLENIKSSRRVSGVGLLNLNLEMQQPIGQAWLFKVKDQGAFAAAFGETNENFQTLAV